MADPSRLPPGAAPDPPLWRAVARGFEVEDDLDALAAATRQVLAAARQATDWVNARLPQSSPETKARLQRTLAAADAADSRGADARQARTGPTRQTLQSIGRSLYEQAAPLWRPQPELAATADLLRQGVASRTAARPQLGGPLGPAMDLAQDWIPNTLIDTGLDMTTPVGFALNVVDPLAPALQAIGPLSHAALPPGFFSRVEKIAAEQVGKKGVTPQRLANLLKSGASAEEVAYRKLPELLASKGTTPITKEELAAHLAAHPAPTVTTQTLGGRPRPKHPFEQYRDELNAKYDGFDFDDLTPEELAKHRALWKEFSEGPAPPEVLHPEYDRESLRLPGGEHYGETLYQMPVPMTKQGRHRVTLHESAPTPSGWSVRNQYDNVSADEVERMRQTYTEPRFRVDAEEIETPLDDEAYTSGHYGGHGYPNVIANARHTERFLPAATRPLDEIEAIIQQAVNARSPQSIASGGPEAAVRQGLISEAEAAAYGHSRGFTNYPELHGIRVAHIDEYQSDLHQKARKAGYRRPPTPEELAQQQTTEQEIEALRTKIAELTLAHRDAADRYFGLLTPAARGYLPPEYAHLENFSQALREGSEATNAWRAAREQVRFDPEVAAARSAELDAEEALQAAVQRRTDQEWALRGLRRATESPYPDLPFKDDAWMGLVMRDRLIQAANDPSIGGVSWSSGKTIADRYDLAKLADRIHFEPDTPGDFSRGSLVAFKDGYEVSRARDVTPEDFKKHLHPKQADALAQQLQAYTDRAAYERQQWGVQPDPDWPDRFHIVDPNGEVLHGYGGDPEVFDSATEAHARIDDLLQEDAAVTPTRARDLPHLEGEDLKFGEQWPFEMYDEKTRRRVEAALGPGTVERLPELPGSGTPGIYQHYNPTTGRYFGPEFDSVEEAGRWRPRPGESGARYELREREAPTPGDPFWLTRFTPELRERIKQGLPFMGVAAAAGAAADQASDNPDEQSSLGPLGAAGLGLAAMIPFAPIRLPRAAGSLAEALKRGEGAMHPLRVSAAERVARLTDFADSFPRLSNWRGINDPRYIRAFRGDVPEAGRHLRAFAAASPATLVADNAREAAALQAWRLEHPGQDITHAQARSLRGQPLGNASSKWQNVNDAWHDRVMGRSKFNDALKVESFGNFMHDRFGPVGHPMQRRSRPSDILWTPDRGQPLIALPHDMHMLYGTGGLPQELLDDEWDPLRARLSLWEGLQHPATGQPLKGNQGGLLNKDLYDRITWSLADTLARQRPDQALQQSFGRFWTGAQANKLLEAGKKVPFAGGFLDIYDNVGLLEPGALTDPDRIYKALERRKDWYNLGWGPGY